MWIYTKYCILPFYWLSQCICHKYNYLLTIAMLPYLIGFDNKIGEIFCDNYMVLNSFNIILISLNTFIYYKRIPLQWKKWNANYYLLQIKWLSQIALFFIFQSSLIEHQLIDLYESLKEQKEIFTLSNHQAPLHCIIPTRIPPFRVYIIKTLVVELL